jgi:hypothetical protein
MISDSQGENMKKHVLPILIMMILLTIACGLGPSGGIAFNEEKTKMAEEQLDENLTSGNAPESIEEPEATSETADLSGPSSQAELSGATGDFVEYSVTGTNNGCICSVDGNNVMQSLDVQDDKLIYNPGGTAYEFQKINDDTFKRTYMGYYILVDTTVDPQVETRVDEEQHDIIILTKDGFIVEHYQGYESSPCCFHTYTRVENTP